jgi:hypothetical protein
MQTQVFNQVELDPQTRAFYCQLMDVLSKSQIPFLVGGGYAFERYTEIARHTKDLDLFVRPNDCLPALSYSLKMATILNWRSPTGWEKLLWR